jgi:phosphoglycerate dehydrogenase-like enzyme
VKLKAVYTDTDDLDPSAGIAQLEAANFRVVRLETHDESEILKSAYDAHALLVGYAPIRESLLAQMPNLEIMSTLSTGFDNVDIAAANSRGICIATVGGTPAEEVATHTLALLLSIIRGLNPYQQSAAKGEWFKTPYPHIPPRLSERTLGVIGFGRIGRRFAAMALPLFGEVLFYDPLIPANQIVEGIKSTSFDAVIENSDVITIHLPLNETTFHLFNAEILARTKTGLYLINVSRGSVLDPVALVQAIENGHIAAAALDVLEWEPPKSDDPMLKHNRILVTPHVGYLSDYTLKAYIDVQAQNVIDWFAGKEMDNAVSAVRIKK